MPSYAPTNPTVGSPRLFGLFVGVNRTASPRIPDLASAVRDADALHALFEDNLGGVNVKLLDEAATYDRLISELDSLTMAATGNDVVVITFSGHGTSTHELVTYDADPADYAGSCLSLNDLTDRISAINARHLLVVLDCCFSGGAGSKVLRSPLMPRGGANGELLSTEALLDQMAGTGRLILTASTAEQPAWEDLVIGHGLLTYHLLQALLGPDEITEHGRVSIYKLLSYVTSHVIATASGTKRAVQEPTLRGTMDGAVTWPVFTAGPLYRGLFPERSQAPVTKEIQSLKGHGIADAVLDRWSAALAGLNDLQQAVVNNAGLLDGKNVLVSAPTSSGKTMLGELAALSAIYRGGRSVFLLPTRALVNEQYERFTCMYGDLGIRVIRATGEISDQVPEIILGQFDIALLTYEKFTGLALAAPHILRLVSVIVVDEVQTLVDPNRGPNLELLLTAIKSRRVDGIAPQIVCLSAVLGSFNGLDSWLEAQAVRWTKRPVQLREGILRSNGIFRFIEDGDEQQEQLVSLHYADRARDFLIPLVRKLMADGQQVIVFRSTKGTARGAAGYLANALQLPAADEVLDALPTGDPNLIAQDLRRCLKGGVAFHVADLDRDEKRVIEEFFRREDSPIRVIVATTTLAQGVNLPAETVIITELDHPAGPVTTTPYTTAEYKNIAGRAGRLGLTKAGTAIILSYGAADEHDKWHRYVTGSPEDVRSSLLGDDTDLYTLILRVVSIASSRAVKSGIKANDVTDILANSFASHQRRLSGANDAFMPANVAEALTELRTQGFIEESADGALQMTSLGRLVAHSGITVRSALNVTRASRMVNAGELNRATLIAIANLTDEVDALLFPVNHRGHQAELRSFIPQLQRHGTANAVLQGIYTPVANEPSRPARRAKKIIATLLWMNGTPAGQFEPVLMQHMRERDAVGAVRALTSRTRDVIDTVVGIAREIHPAADIDMLSDQLPVQLELGVPADMVPLARILGATLTRQAYIDLAANGFADPQAIANTDDDKLATFVGVGAVERIRRAAEQVSSQGIDIPNLDELLGPPVD